MIVNSFATKNPNMYDYFINNSTNSINSGSQTESFAKYNNSESEIPFAEVLSKLTGEKKIAIKSYSDYKAKSFGSDTSETYSEFVKNGLSVAKVYTTIHYQKLLKDAEEFEKLIKKLVEQASKNNKAAKDALAMISKIFEGTSIVDRDPKEVFAELLSKIKSEIKKFNPTNAKESDKAMFELLDLSLKAIAKTNDSNIDELSKAVANHQVFDDEKTENNYLSTMFSKIKQKKRYDPAESTKEYVKKKDKEDLISSKIEKINTLRYSDEPSAKDEISKLVNEISTLGFERSKLFILDPAKLTRSIQSPMFA
jgi:hypothetical protein